LYTIDIRLNIKILLTIVHEPPDIKESIYSTRSSKETVTVEKKNNK